MGAVIPLITAKTDKPGEFYPFSNFPMYSSFEPDTYLVYITDLEDKPLAISPIFGTSASDIKKTYDRKLGELKPRAPKGTRKANLPPALKQEAAAVLQASGLDLSTAIRLFLRSVVETGGLPMAMPRPNAETLAAIKAAKAGQSTGVSLDDL